MSSNGPAAAAEEESKFMKHELPAEETQLFELGDRVPTERYELGSP